MRFNITIKRFNNRGQVLVFLVPLLFFNLSVLAEIGPVEVLQTMTERLQEVVKEKPAVLDDYASMHAIVNELVVPHVDFQIMSRWALGKHWRTASPEQRDTFAERFKEVLIRTYLSSLGDYGGSTNYQAPVIRYLPLENTDNKIRVIVRTEVDQPNAQPIDVRFRMLKRDSGWKIYDVIVEGISMVATNRSSYSAIIRKEGLDGLLVKLHARETASRNPERSQSAETGFE